MHSEQAAPDLLQKSLDASGVGWWQLDFGQREMTCSRLAADLFGADRTRISFEEVYLLPGEEHRARIYTRCAALKVSDSLDETFVTANGDRCLQVRAVAAANDPLTGVRSVFGTVRRVTEGTPENAELASINQSYKATQRNYSHLAQLIEHLPIGYLRVNILRNKSGEAVDYLLSYINQQAGRILGIHTQGHAGKTAREVGIDPLKHIPTFEHIPSCSFWEQTGKSPDGKRTCRCLIYNTPGDDDDGNGYVDDIYGYNFTKETGELDFSAELMHGTHVAGTIAAVNNNGVGVCGIAGGSGRGDGVKIMSCEILGKSESGSSGAGLAGQIRAIKYAADNGAVICQNSWGYTAGTISVTDWTRGSYSALSRAMEYFNKYAGLDENGNQTGPMAGGIVLFAAGNDASSEVCYPAADANAISVGATAFTGAPAYYTNYGTWVQISAPGGDQMLSNAYGGVYSTSVAADGSSGYEGSQGTSMACPHVSGACALAVSYYYGAEKRKGLTGEMLRQALLSSTQSVDRYCTGKYQQYLGNMGIGSLDTYKLLRNIAKIDGIPAQRVGVGDTVSIDLGDHFTATNVLGYTVSVPDLVKIELRGGVMKLTGLKKGRTTIIVSDGAAIRKPIEVTVE